MNQYYLIDGDVPVKIEASGRVLVYRPHKGIYESGRNYLKYIYESPAYSDREVKELDSVIEFEKIVTELRAAYLKKIKKD